MSEDKPLKRVGSASSLGSRPVLPPLPSGSPEKDTKGRRVQSGAKSGKGRRKDKGQAETSCPDLAGNGDNGVYTSKC